MSCELRAVSIGANAKTNANTKANDNANAKAKALPFDGGKLLLLQEVDDLVISATSTREFVWQTFVANSRCLYSKKSGVTR